MMSSCFHTIRTAIAFCFCAGVCSPLFSQIVNAADTVEVPGSYGSATHQMVVPGPFFGEIAADEHRVAADVTALNHNDEPHGGTSAFPVLVQNSSSYSVNVFATNPIDVAATISAWVDFDGNGKFDIDEFATTMALPGTLNFKYKLVWPDLLGVSTDFLGTSYVRFRISSALLLAADATGEAPDGEVKDYSVDVQLDSDGDDIPDAMDLDNDNDGIRDAQEGTDVDTDGDGTVNSLDLDSDADSIPDYIEAGENPLEPIDTDLDGVPDYLDVDSNDDGILDINDQLDDVDGDGLPDVIDGTVDSDGDGIVNLLDLDSDNDTIPDAIERGTQNTPADSDQDGIADYLDLDSDNDGIIDIREANGGELDINRVDVDNDGRVDDAQLTGMNGFLDRAETDPDSGIPIYSVVDSDSDGIRDFRDLDSDNDGISDLLETLGSDADSNGLLDSVLDVDRDGLIDGGNSISRIGSFADTDADSIPDFQDDNADGRTQTQDDLPDTDALDNPGPLVDGSDPLAANTPVVGIGLAGGAGCSLPGQSPWQGLNKRIDVVFPLVLFLSLGTCLARFVRRHAVHRNSIRKTDTAQGSRFLCKHRLML
ncbi:MAG: GEVED domain-containing protein [Granulosicoccus sp.]